MVVFVGRLSSAKIDGISMPCSAATSTMLPKSGRAPGYNFHDPDPSLRMRPTAEARAVLGEAVFQEARVRGLEMTFEQAVAYALSEADAPE
jgi:hypothetical protein